MITLKMNPSHQYFLPLGRNIQEGHRGYAFGGVQWNTFKNWINDFSFSVETGSTLAATMPYVIAWFNAQARSVGTLLYSACGLRTLYSSAYTDVASFSPSTEGTPATALSAFVNSITGPTWGASCGNSATRFFYNHGTSVVSA